MTIPGPVTEIDGIPQYAQAAMTGPDGREMTIIHPDPPGIYTEQELQAREPEAG